MISHAALCEVCREPLVRAVTRGRPPKVHPGACKRAARADAEARLRAAVREYEEEQRLIVAGRRPRGVLVAEDLGGEDVGEAVGLAPGAPAAILDPARGLRRWQDEPQSDLDRLANRLLSGDLSADDAARLFG